MCLAPIGAHSCGILTAKALIVKFQNDSSGVMEVPGLRSRLHSFPVLLTGSRKNLGSFGGREGARKAKPDRQPIAIWFAIVVERIAKLFKQMNA